MIAVTQINPLSIVEIGLPEYSRFGEGKGVSHKNG